MLSSSSRATMSAGLAAPTVAQNAQGPNDVDGAPGTRLSFV